MPLNCKTWVEMWDFLWSWVILVLSTSSGQDLSCQAFCWWFLCYPLANAEKSAISVVIYLDYMVSKMLLKFPSFNCSSALKSETALFSFRQFMSFWISLLQTAWTFDVIFNSIKSFFFFLNHWIRKKVGKKGEKNTCFLQSRELTFSVLFCLSPHLSAQTAVNHRILMEGTSGDCLVQLFLD